MKFLLGERTMEVNEATIKNLGLQAYCAYRQRDLLTMTVEELIKMVDETHDCLAAERLVKLGWTAPFTNGNYTLSWVKGG
jgi:hypothetical protein